VASLVDGGPDVDVRASLADALPSPRPEHLMVLHATGSFLDRVGDQLFALIEAGVHVVSTCEELAYPWARAPDLSRDLNEKARAAGLTVVGTGINPGFLMDQFPVSLTGATHDVRSVRVTRVQNPRRRRIPFQKKVGMDITREEYAARQAAGGFGHVGLVESGRLIAAGLGWSIDAWDNTLEAVLSPSDDLVLGTRQILRGETADGRSIALRFEAQSGVEEDFDETIIEGTPPLHVRFQGGVFGDDGTAAAVLRAARVIPSAPRGLITVLDLPLRARPENG
jgi:4-hydroxy-tetrahydrodipicolinate reductase